MLLLIVCFAAIACCFALSIKLMESRKKTRDWKCAFEEEFVKRIENDENHREFRRRKAAQIRLLFQSRSRLIKEIADITERGAARELELQAAYRNLEMVLNEPPIYAVWQRSLNHKFDRDYLREAFQNLRRPETHAQDSVDAMSLALTTFGKHSLKHLAAEHLLSENETNEEKEMS